MPTESTNDPTLFKLLFAGAAALAMFYFLVATRRSAFQRLFVLFLFGAGILFVLRPELSNDAARLVGIGRGADLVLYVSTLFLLFLSVNHYLRFKDVDEKLTRLVRQLALMQPVLRDERDGD